MASVTRKGPGLVGLINILADVDNLETKVGWFEGQRYENGMPVAAVAAVHELGSTHTHPGGTRYVVRDGVATFVGNDFTGPVHGVTKPHQIVIPPRPFFRTTVSEKADEWSRLTASGAKAMLNGNATAHQVMAGLGMAAEGDVKKTISELTAPPLKSSTVKARKAKLAKGKKVGNLTKPLVETGIMIKTLSSAVESK